MNAFEWVGFFVSMLSVLFLMGKSFYDALQRNKNPTKYQAQQEEAERRFKAFLRGDTSPTPMGRILREVMDEEEEIEEEPVQVKERVSFRPVQQVSVPQLQQITLPDEHKERPSYVKNLLSHEHPKKNMVILSEVFGKPKALREGLW